TLGDSMIVLTKALMADRRFCRTFFEPDYAPLLEDMARSARPYWNGEDIVLSLAATKLTGKNHVRHNLPATKLPQLGVAISKNLKEHREYRTRLLRVATERFGIPCR
ncbi:hypothetical protein CYMTET_33997, partial [Cymbomonas tetramitiformis]